MTLTEFLLARIAEDEAVAQDALVADIATVAHEHMERWNPDRVLAECEAKRRIIERGQRAEVAFAQTINPTTSGVSVTMLLVLSDLALPYADHPDYRDEP